MKLGLTSEQLAEVKDKYSRALKEFREYHGGINPLNIGKGITPEEKEQADGFATSFALMAITTNFRDLYDFFDLEGIYASVLTHVRSTPIGMGATIILIDEKGSHFYNSNKETIDFGKRMGTEVEYMEIPEKTENISDRLHIERYMFLKCFQILDEKIKAKQDSR